MWPSLLTDADDLAYLVQYADNSSDKSCPLSIGFEEGQLQVAKWGCLFGFCVASLKFCKFFRALELIALYVSLCAKLI